MRIVARLSWITAILAINLASSLAQEAAPMVERDRGGPRTIVITYRCEVAKRPAFREYMLKTGVNRFEQWKRDGIFEDYRIVFNRVSDQATWDAMAVLTLRTYTDMDRWRDIEAETPGGLTSDGLAIATPTNTYSMDVLWHGSAQPPVPRGKTVFFMIPYDYYPHSIEEYVKYAETYVMPQIRGWMQEGVLANYAIYLNRYATSRPWKVLFVLEYKDSASFGARELTMAKVRARLKEDPKWKALSDAKQSIRLERETVVADELLPREQSNAGAQ